MARVADIRKTVTDKTPVLAVVGLTDLAVEKVRKARTKATAVRVDLDAIRGNVATLKQGVGDAAVMAVVKADGYGHGMAESARAALSGGATWLGVKSGPLSVALRAAGIDAPTLAWLLGPADDWQSVIAANVDVGLEIPQALGQAVAAGLFGAPGKSARYTGVIVLGCVIRGETSHYDIVANESARGIMDLTMAGLAIGNGILTCDTEAQAWARARVAEMDKGGGAADAALTMVRFKRDIKKRRKRS